MEASFEVPEDRWGLVGLGVQGEVSRERPGLVVRDGA